MGEDMGVLGGLRPPNTPTFLHRSGDSQTATIITDTSLILIQYEYLS
jgi:hypothetical protein